MADISFDPTSVIRATDPAAPGSAAAQSKADSAPTFGDHLSRARRSNSSQSPADGGEANQTQPASSQDPKPDDAAPKSSRDDQQQQPQKAAPDKRDDSAPDSQPTDSGANAAAAAANPAAATPQPAPDKDAIKAAETAGTTDAVLKAAAASQTEANKSATSPAAATAEQTAAAQATAAAAATTAIPQPAPAPAPTRDPHPAADQAPGAAKTTPINPQLTALIESTAAKAAAANSAPATSTAAPRPQTPAGAAPASGAATSAATKALLASQALPSAASAQRDASAPSQNSQDGSNAAAGAANAAVVAATQIVVDAASVKPAATAVDKILSDATRQAGQDPTAPTPSTSTSQPPSGAAGQLPGAANNFAAGVQAKAGADGSLAATTDADRLRFVQRVARAFQAAGDNGGQVKLRLSPPELGSLQVNITMKDGTMTAHIQAETSSAQNLLLNNLPDLRDRLAQQDIRIDRFDVELMDRSPGGMPQTPDRNSNADDFNRRPAPARNAAAGDGAIEAVGPAAASVYQGGGGLNVVI